MAIAPQQYTELVKPFQDSYAQLSKPFQDATLAIAQAWTRSFQQTAARVPVAVTQAATNAAAHQFIDQAYNFATTVIDVQRNLSKQIVSSSSSVAQDVAERAATAVNDAGAQVFEAAAKAGRAKKPVA